jgi:hypothetical protein
MPAASFSKIAEACPGEVSIQWHELDGAYSVKVSGVLPADVTLFGDLLDAVTAGREVSFDYHKLTGSEPEHRTVQPYHVGQIEHGWYVLAYVPGREGCGPLPCNASPIISFRRPDQPSSKSEAGLCIELFCHLLDKRVSPHFE